MPPSPNPRLLYVYDALCGWCYGFSPTLRTFVKTHGASVKVLSGGMIRGERRGPIGEVAAYIKRAYKDVEHRTGVKFGKGFVDGPLERGDMYMTSEPPAALLAWAREQRPDRQLDAAHALQDGIYDLGFGPDSDELATYLAVALDLDAAAAVAARTAPTYEAAARRDFALCEELGVRGFPALFVEQPDGLVAIANGFTDGHTLGKHLAAVTATPAQTH